MFKYPKTQKEEEKKPEEAKPTAEAPVEIVQKDVSPEALRELLEKNLKWSQIIYEQTRKINSKLFWKSVWGWVVFFVLVVAPTALAIWYLPPLLRELENKYQPLFSLIGSGSATTTSGSKGSVDDILKLLPHTDEQKASLKAMLGSK